MEKSHPTVLSKTLRNNNFTVGRLKTGTPPRIDGRTIDYSKVEVQPGDLLPRPFSELTDKVEVPQTNCYITRTTSFTHQIIKITAFICNVFWSNRRYRA